MKIIALSERDHLLRQRANLFRLRQGRHQAAVIEEVRHQVSEQGTPMGRVPAQLPVGIAMSHKICSADDGITGRPWSSSRIPSARPMLDRISLISFSDLRPKFLVFSISASLLVTSSPIVRML